MPISLQRPPALSRYDARMLERAGSVALVALALSGAAPHARGAEGPALRGLRAPALIDFASPDPYRPGMPAATAAADPTLPGEGQASALYGMREQRRASPTAETARFAYAYSDSLTGVVESAPAAQDAYGATYALSGQVVRSFASGLGIGLGLRQRQFGSNLFALGVQQGWGPLRGGYTLYSGRGDAGASPSHRFALALDYGNRSSIGLSFTAGRDLQAGMLPYAASGESRDWALSGRHWLAPQWALTYDVVNSDRAAYRRQGLRFGIRHTF